MSKLTPDEHFMLRALELAAIGQGRVSPNPMVGCVIVFENEIIGEGWHIQYGEPHAEVNAINNVRGQSNLEQSTLYVNLEPCSHFGKTPPCADMLINKKIKRVVICNQDSNPLVAGQGIYKLRLAGIEVTTGVLDEQGRNLNKRFFSFMEKKRPYIILKWAETADRFIARENFDSKWISNEISRQLVHKWRSEEDAVLTGMQTVAYDNPRLNVRDWTGRNPVRIIMDRFLKLDGSLHVFDRSQPTICYNVVKNEFKENLAFVKLTETSFIQDMIEDLTQRKVQSILVEGGATTLSLFFQADMWDEARVFTSKTSFGKGIPAPVVQGNLIEQFNVANDILTIYKPQ